MDFLSRYIYKNTRDTSFQDQVRTRVRQYPIASHKELLRSGIQNKQYVIPHAHTSQISHML